MLRVNVGVFVHRNGEVNLRHLKARVFLVVLFCFFIHKLCDDEKKQRLYRMTLAVARRHLLCVTAEKIVANPVSQPVIPQVILSGPRNLLEETPQL